MATGDDLLVFLYDDKGTPYGMFTVLDGVQQYFFYLYNAQGDVIAIIDDYAERVVNYEYSAWGELLSVTGSKADTVGVLNPFRYRGYCYDTETGLYYLNSRYYDPVTQRFVNGDGYASTGQGILGNNMFAYCLNNPVNMHDLTGSRAVENDHRGAWIMVTNTGMLISCSRKETVISTIPANKYKPSLSAIEGGVSYEEFIRAVYKRAKYGEAETGIPATLMVAQACYESGYGGSDYSKQNKNILGLGGGSFKYSSYDECIDSYERNITGLSCYKKLFESDSLKDWVYGIGPAGYCPEPGYGDGVWGVIAYWDLEDENKWLR